jgi:hypothetical protein
MPNIDELFPSNYLTGEEIKDKGHIPVVIDRVVREDIGDDEQKPVIYFRGARKGLVLNRTNANEIATAYGRDYSLWPGKRIEVFFDPRVEYKGRRTGGVRVDVPADELAKPEQLKSEPKPNSSLQEDGLNDSIPF